MENLRHIILDYALLLEIQDLLDALLQLVGVAGLHHWLFCAVGGRRHLFLELALGRGQPHLHLQSIDIEFQVFRKRVLEVLKGRIQQFSVLVALLLQLLPFQKYFTPSFLLLFELILAANYMDIKPLLDLTCATVASMIKGKSPEEIRSTFNITNDFSPEEEAQVREENKWCEEA